MAQFEKNNAIGNRFPKGTSGNPKGRPQSAFLSDALRRKLQGLMPGASEKTIADGIADALIEQALDGDVSAIREVFNRSEGAVSQKIDASLEIFDWQSAIRDFGISPEAILNEAKQLLSDSEFDESNIE